MIGEQMFELGKEGANTARAWLLRQAAGGRAGGGAGLGWAGRGGRPAAARGSGLGARAGSSTADRRPGGNHSVVPKGWVLPG